MLGRIDPRYFPHIFGPDENEPLDVDTVHKKFEALSEEIYSFTKRSIGDTQNGKPMSAYEVALGFLKVANEAMCRYVAIHMLSGNNE
jgi:5-oxoprolinase (ATP-hydrolysing)